MEFLSIDINGSSQTILCGRCKEPVAFVGEPNIETGKAGCVACGNVDEVQDVARIAIDYAKDELQLRLNRAALDAARKSKLMTFSGQTAHDQEHRFIVDLKD